MISEHHAAGTLKELLADRSKTVLSVRTLCGHATNVASALEFLQKSGVVHTDVAARNVELRCAFGGAMPTRILYYNWVTKSSFD